jgi:hypothetical protein
VHVDADAEPEPRPKWAKTTLQDVEDLVGDPTDTRRTQSDLESLLLNSFPLNLCHPCIFYWFSLQIHSLMVRLLELPFGNPPCSWSTTPSSSTRLGIWFPFLQEGNLSGADGSIGPRAQWMDRLADTKPC